VHTPPIIAIILQKITHFHLPICATGPATRAPTADPPVVRD